MYARPMGDDIEDIKRLKARYFRCMDQKDWDAWAQVFATDAVMEIPEVDRVLNGRDAIVGFVSRVLASARTVHQGHMPEIELTGADAATGIWAMFDYVELPASESGERSGFQGYGHYTEEYVREDGACRIAPTPPPPLPGLRVDPLA